MSLLGRGQSNRCRTGRISVPAPTGHPRSQWSGSIDHIVSSPSAPATKAKTVSAARVSHSERDPIQSASAGDRSLIAFASPSQQGCPNPISSPRLPSPPTSPIDWWKDFVRYSSSPEPHPHTAAKVSPQDINNITPERCPPVETSVSKPGKDGFQTKSEDRLTAIPDGRQPLRRTPFSEDLGSSGSGMCPQKARMGNLLSGRWPALSQRSLDSETLPIHYFPPHELDISYRLFKVELE